MDHSNLLFHCIYLMTYHDLHDIHHVFCRSDFLLSSMPRMSAHGRVGLVS